MGNDESCCDDIEEKKGETESKANSLKYGSTIRRAQDPEHKSSHHLTEHSVLSSNHPQPKGIVFDP